MASCRYCVEFVESKQRNEPKGENTPKGRRVCAATKTWKSPIDEMCDNYVTHSKFWCDRLQCDMDLDSCLNRVKKKLHKKCKKSCSQYYDVLEAMRFRARTRK